MSEQSTFTFDSDGNVRQTTIPSEATEKPQRETQSTLDVAMATEAKLARLRASQERETK